MKRSMYHHMHHRYFVYLFIVSLCLFSCANNRETSVRLFEQEILPHPRLLFSAQEEERVNESVTSEPLLKELTLHLTAEANRLLDVPLQQYTLRDVNYVKDILTISREQVYRMVTLSMAYRLTKDTRYAIKAEEELNNVCDFPDWNPAHYLDVAEMTTAVAIGYDWLYDVLSPSTKEKIVSAIKTKALDLTVEEYKTGGQGSWAKRETNWNVVCNTGMVLGALAVADEYPELTQQIIHEAVKYVPNCLTHFAPDGVCYEGPSYWGYTNMYLSLLLKALNDNLGQDFGLSELPGVDKAVLYYIHSTSPSGKIFNFANSGGTAPDADPIYFYFSRKFNQPEAAGFYRDLLAEKVGKSNYPRFFFLSIPWFDPSPASLNTLPKLTVYEGINDIVVFNGDRSKPNSIYLIAKTGDPDMAHQQLDVGTFIVETNGVRWSDDLGADNYSLPGFWDYKPDGQRWHYFRNTNFSHNTLSIDQKLQYSAGTGEIEKYDDQSAQPYVTMNLNTAYTHQAQSVYRTFQLLNDTQIRIVDNISLLSDNQSVQWSMITAADVTCNGHTATLQKDGKTFTLIIESPANAVFTSRPANTFSEKENPVEGYTIVSASASDHKTHTFSILLSGESTN